MNAMPLVNQITYQQINHMWDYELTGIQIDSRKVKSGNIFVCLNGEHVDGHNYIDQAIQNGAICIVTEKEVDVPDDVIHLRVASTYRSLAEISSVFYERPTSELTLIGITGTNGKTSVTQFLNQLYRMKGYKTGVIGTIHIDMDGEIYPTENTTPFAHDIQRIMREMRNKGITHVFMEVSSHGLSMGRVWGCEFNHAVFTNLSQDHLDYHKTMDEYKQAKGLLFTSMGYGFDKTVVLNADDEASSYYQHITGTTTLLYGKKSNADLRVSDIVQNEKGLSFTLHYQKEKVRMKTGLVGEFHAYNLMAAISVCLTEEWSLENLSQYVKKIEAVKGRMENIRCGQRFDVIVDFAHTPDGLQNALSSIKVFAKGKILTVVGCGGNRDRGKRPIMASIAEEYSDYVFLTSDNPRNEEPLAILKDMEKGMKGKEYIMYVNRERAIMEALQKAEDGDVILIAGKGHEEYQIIGDVKTPFSDKKIVVRELEEIVKRQDMTWRDKIEEFESGFPDGVYVAPSDPKEPTIKIRALLNYCKENALHVSDLTEEQIAPFYGYPK